MRRKTLMRRPYLIPFPFLFFFFFLLSFPTNSDSLIFPTSLTYIPNLISLSHSLLLRVANARTSRNDHAGATRIRSIADKISLLGPGGGVWALGWDYARNYAWRGGGLGIPVEEIGRMVREIADVVGGLGRCRTDAERAVWGVRNYGRLRRLFEEVIRGLRRGISRSGPLRDMVLILQKEIMEGELIRDCLDVGAKDLEGLVTVARDFFFQSSRSGGHDNPEL